MKTLTLLFCLFTVYQIDAQESFYKLYNSKSTSSLHTQMGFIATSDNGFIFCQPGTDTLVATGGGFSVIKTDSLGNILWASFIHSIPALGNASHIPKEIIELGDSSFVILAIYFNSHIRLIHIDPSGNLISNTELETLPQNSNPSGYAMVLDNDSTVVIAGYHPFNVKGLILKSTVSGNVLWAKSYKTPLSSGVLATGQCIIRNIIKTQDNGFLATGTLRDTLGVSSSSYLQVFKIDEDGNINWSRTILDPTGSQYFTGKVMQTINGDFIILGKSPQTGFNDWQCVLKLDINGVVEWYKGFKGNSSVTFTAMHERYGNIILGGMFYDPVSIKRCGVTAIDSTGDLVPEFDYLGISYNSLLVDYNPGNDYSNVSVKFPNNNYALFYNNYRIGSYEYNPAILKTDSLYFSQCNMLGTNLYDTTFSVAVDTSYISANFSFGSIDKTSEVGSTPMNIITTEHCQALSISNVNASESRFNVYPNPCNGLFNLVWDEINYKGSLMIYNSTGDIVFCENINQDTGTGIDIRHLVKGLYLVRFISEGNQFYKKLILQ